MDLLSTPPNSQTAGFDASEFAELADNAPVMIWRSRPDKMCDWFNKPWRDFSGKTQAELFGYGWAEDVHPDDLERCVSIYETAFDAHRPFTMPYRLKRADGIYRWFLDNGAPFYRGNEFAGYFGSCVDITDQRDLQEHQEVLLAELNHRVKNNLQLIITFLHLAKLKAHGAEAKTLMQAAIGRIRAVGAVQDELHRSTSTTGTVDLGEYLFSLARAVLSAEADGSAKLIADTQSVLVSFELASNLGLIVNELITNAIKHGNTAEGAVTLRVRRLSSSIVEMSVADEGKGFETLNSTDQSSVGKGVGLIDALARRCHATLTRTNSNGAHVALTFPIEETGSGKGQL